MSTITSTPTVTGTYTIDPTHSRIGFVARHAMVTKVRGSFNEFEGHGYLRRRRTPPTRTAEVTIKVASIDTRNEQRDGHLRSNDFFDIDDLPGDHLRLHRRRARSTTTTYRVTGDLTIKGVTKPVTIDFEYTGAATDPFGNSRVGFEGSVDRQPQGLGRHLERRPRDRRRAGQREGHPRVRDLRHP